MPSDTRHRHATRRAALRGVLLDRVAWPAAEAALASAAVVVVPLGAALKQHGPHLPLDTDWRTAEWFRQRLAETLPVIVTPTVGFHHYPAFVDYPGTVSLEADTSVDLVTQICLNLSRAGPRRFYVLNTGVSTLGPLKRSAAALANAGCLLRFTDIEAAGAEVAARLAEQGHGGHADEVETSMMLVISPDSVDMARACRDGGPGRGRFRRNPGHEGIFSASGVNGDARLATKTKGEAILDAMLEHIVADIRALTGVPVSETRLDTPGGSG